MQFGFIRRLRIGFQCIGIIEQCLYNGDSYGEWRLRFGRVRDRGPTLRQNEGFGEFGEACKDGNWERCWELEGDCWLGWVWVGIGIRVEMVWTEVQE